MGSIRISDVNMWGEDIAARALSSDKVCECRGYGEKGLRDKHGVPAE
jgi:hypothetical protein